MLLGPEYSIIDKSENIEKNRKFTIIFNFGGSGDIKHCYDILKEIKKYKLDKIQFIIIVGPLSKSLKFVNKLSKRKNVKIVKIK